MCACVCVRGIEGEKKTVQVQQSSGGWGESMLWTTNDRDNDHDDVSLLLALCACVRACV